MDDVSYQTYKIKNPDAKQETEKYYCFNARELNEVETLTKKLETLIEVSKLPNATIPAQE